MRIICFAFMFLSVSAAAELKTVPYVDVGRYLGNWYQIARNPVFFENGCVCSRQQLTLRNDGLVGVYNTCNRDTVSGPLMEIRGVATNVDPSSNAKFKVDFNLPNKGDYWIIGLAEDYRWAIVSEPSAKVLYILSKTPQLSEEDYNSAVKTAAAQVDTSKLTRTSQVGCQYP